MGKGFPGPWVQWVVEQIWVVRQITCIVARRIDVELPRDPQAMAGYGLKPIKEQVIVRIDAPADAEYLHLRHGGIL